MSEKKVMPKFVPMCKVVKYVVCEEDYQGPEIYELTKVDDKYVETFDHLSLKDIEQIFADCEDSDEMVWFEYWLEPLEHMPEISDVSVHEIMGRQYVEVQKLLEHKAKLEEEIESRIDEERILSME